MTFAQDSRLKASSLICNTVVPSDAWKSLELSLISLIIMTGSVSIDPDLKKESYIFLWVLGCVFLRFLVTHELHIQNTLRPQSGSGAGY